MEHTLLHLLKTGCATAVHCSALRLSWRSTHQSSCVLHWTRDGKR